MPGFGSAGVPPPATPLGPPEAAGSSSEGAGPTPRRPPLWLFTLALYLAVAVIELRGGLGGSGTLPAGTNAGDFFLVSWFQGHWPIGTWLYPYTDWGQPFPGFTGPTLLTPGVLILYPTVLTRLIEFTAYVAAGLGVYWVVRKADGTWAAATVAGFYYMLLVQAGEFTEGHVTAMISVALAPPFLYSLYRLVLRPHLNAALLTAVLLYLLVSIGDLGILYFVLFFGILLAGFVFLWRWSQEKYRWGDLLPIGLGLGLFVLLVASWLVPFVYGARPEYTTSITANTLPFSQAAGTNLALAFVGFFPDTSYLNLTYGIPYFWFGGLALLPLFAILPLVLGFYAFSTKNPRIIVFYLSGLLAVVFATGPQFPGLSAFNGWMYDHVPFFNSIPEVFRWTVYALIVYGLLLGKMLTDIERDLGRGAPWLRHEFEGWMGRFRKVGRAVVRRRPAPGPEIPSARLTNARRGWTEFARARGRRVLTIACVAIGALAVAQTAVVFALPPGVYSIPTQYSTGYTYLDGRPLTGGVLTVPFSAIYERAPWCGVCVAGPVQTPAFTGADTVSFLAGTPYSLALDWFVGDGMTYGYSTHMVRFLAGVNVQYVLSTRYSNWSVPSSSIYPPQQSYRALANQTGLGTPVFSQGQQQVYAVPGAVGNVSFHPTYDLYFGGSALLYTVINQPWFNGTNIALIDGSSLAGNREAFVQHATTILVNVLALSSVPTDVWNWASQYGVPVVYLAPPIGIPPIGLAPSAHPGPAPAMVGAGAGESFLGSASLDSIGAVLSQAERTGGWASAHLVISGVCAGLAPGPTDAGASTGEGARSAPGTSPSQERNPAQPSESGPASPRGTDPRLTTGSATNSNTNPYTQGATPTSGVLRAPGLGAEMSGVYASTSGAHPVAFSTSLTLPYVAPLLPGRLGTAVPSGCPATAASLTTSTPSSGVPPDRYLGPQPDSTDVTFPSASAGWGVLVSGQTYSPLWNTSGPVPPVGSAVASVGLEAWLINVTNGGVWRILYRAQPVLETTLLVQGVALASASLATGVIIVRRVRRRPRQPSTRSA